jgi:hypothetical protein
MADQESLSNTVASNIASRISNARKTWLTHLVLTAPDYELFSIVTGERPEEILFRFLFPGWPDRVTLFRLWFVHMNSILAGCQTGYSRQVIIQRRY